MLGRTLPYLSDGSCFGVVVPQGFLHSKDAAELPREVLAQFEIDEILLFPEQRLCLLRHGIRRPDRQETAPPRERSIKFGTAGWRERSVDEFQRSYGGSTERIVPQSRFLTDGCDLRVPELEEVWNSVASLPHQLSDLADVGRGFSPKSDEPRKGTPFYFDEFAEGRDSVYHVFPSGIGLHELPHEEWADLSEENIDRPRWGLTHDVPQVLFNYASSGRGPWRLKARSIEMDTRSRRASWLFGQGLPSCR